MKLRAYLVATGAVLFLTLGPGEAAPVDLAKVNGEAITADEFILSFRSVAVTAEIPENTPEGKREFLDRLIAKHLLSQYIRAQGWDTLSHYEYLIKEYQESLYLEALYRAGVPGFEEELSLRDIKTFMDKTGGYVDSLRKAYNSAADPKAVTLIAERSAVRRVEPGHDHAEPEEVSWPDLFTDEEKEMVALRFVYGHITIGEFAAAVEELPPFARPTGGNTDEIEVTLEHIGKEKIIEHEFFKLGLDREAFFVERTKSKREELVLILMFNAMKDTVRVTSSEVQDYYEAHRDNFVTVPVINLAYMSFQSEEVALRAAARVLEGEDFAEVAVDFSIYSGSEAGYDTTGYIDNRKYPGLFQAIWDREIGTVVGPVWETDRWMVAKLLERLDPRLLSLQEAAQQIAQRVAFLKADEAFANLIEELRSKATVEVDYQALDALEIP